MRDWKYIVYVVVAITLFALVKLIRPKQYDWSVTFAHYDKNPYGTYALHQLLPDLFTGGITHSYLTLYELKDSLRPNDNVVILATGMSLGEEDTDVLLNHVKEGATAFLSAEYFWGQLPDTLQVIANREYFGISGESTDSIAIRFVNKHLASDERYYLPNETSRTYFGRYDSTRTTVLARDELDRPVTLRITWGKGSLIMNCTPLALTNMHLLRKNNASFATGMLSFLSSPGRVVRTEYYHLGRMEASTPLRFVLNTEPLQWAYWIALLSILLFMVFEAKRKQRVIPILPPLPNTSLEFVTTIGNLYYRNGNHKDIADKKIAFLLEQIRTRYKLRTNELDEAFFEALSSKSGKDIGEIRRLFRTIGFIQSMRLISPGQLMDLNEKIECFNQP